MKKILILGLYLSIVINLYATSPEAENLRRNEDKLKQKFPEIQSLIKQSPNDYEISLGLLFLQPYLAFVEFPEFENPVDKVISLNPNNKIAWYTKAKYACFDYQGVRKRLLYDMQGMVKYAVEHNLDKLKVFDGSDGLFLILVQYEKPKHLQKDKFGRYEVMQKPFELDFDRAEEILEDYLHKKFAADLEIIATAEKIDPNNAHYCFLKAGLYLDAGDEEKGIEQLKIASGKKLQTYKKQKEQLIAKSLNAISLDKESTEYFLSIFQYNENYEPEMYHIWYDNLLKVIDRHEKESNIDKARELCALSIKISDMIPDDERGHVRSYQIKPAAEEQLSKLKIK